MLQVSFGITKPAICDTFAPLSLTPSRAFPVILIALLGGLYRYAV